MGPLRAALVTPISGPLARFGTAGAAALRLWAMRASGVPAPWTGVELEVIDAYPSAATAMGRELGLELRATPYAPGQVAPAADALPPADALLVVGGFDDELAAAHRLLGRGWRAAAFVGAGGGEGLAPAL